MDQAAVFAFMGLFAGVYWFCKGFRFLRRKRIMENTPTSKIRSMAMGQVEIVGIAHEEVVFTAPFSQRECVYYRYQIQELRRSKNSTYWATIRSGDSSTSPFYVEDDTGRALVNPVGAEIDVPVTFEMQIKGSEEIPEHIARYLDQCNVKYMGWFGLKRTLRFLEHAVFPNQRVYVMGVCQSNSENLASNRRQQLNEALRKLKEDPALMQQFDTNRDGNISLEEWEAARQVVQGKINQAQEKEHLVFIGRSRRSDELFYISDKSERMLVSQFNLAAASGIFIGPLCAVAGLGYLIHYFSGH